MNWDILEGKWDQMKGDAKIKWGKLTDSDLTSIRGRRDVLIGKLQEKYGMKRDAAERDADKWLKQL